MWCPLTDRAPQDVGGRDGVDVAEEGARLPGLLQRLTPLPLPDQPDVPVARGLEFRGQLEHK